MAEKKQRVLGRWLAWMDEKALNVEMYPSCNEPRYDDKVVIAADWNPPKDDETKQVAREVFW